MSKQYKKNALLSTLSILAVMSLSWGVWRYLQSRPPSMPDTAEEAAALVTSDRFARLSAERQRELTEQIDSKFGEQMNREQLSELAASLEIDADDLRSAVDQMMDVMLDIVSVSAKEWARAETDAERQAIMDELQIAMQDMMQRNQMRLGLMMMSDPEGAQQIMEDAMQDTMQEMSESGNPQDSGLMIEMFEGFGRMGG